MNERFTLGKVIATGLRVWAKNFVPFVLITVVVYLPLIAYTIWKYRNGLTLESYNRLARDGRWLLAITPLLNVIVSSALTYGVVRELQGERASLGACIATGLARMLPVLGVGVIMSVATGVGFVLLLVPGFFLLTRWYVAVQASVLERPGLVGAFRRSSELTKGHRVALLGLFFLLFLVTGATSALAAQIFLPGTHDFRAYMDAIPRYEVINLVRLLLVGSLWAVTTAVAYYYLRQEKEGTSAAELAKVFE